MQCNFNNDTLVKIGPVLISELLSLILQHLYIILYTKASCFLICVIHILREWICGKVHVQFHDMTDQTSMIRNVHCDSTKYKGSETICCIIWTKNLLHHAQVEPNLLLQMDAHCCACANGNQSHFRSNRLFWTKQNINLHEISARKVL